MRSFPLPVRVAAGAAVTAAECARRAPGALAGLPITALSWTLQTSMRLQQQVTELALKGDTALAGLGRPEEHPAWATFDEDDEDDEDEVGSTTPAGDDLGPAGPVEDNGPGPAAASAPPGRARDDAPPACLPEYTSLSLAQLRGKLRALSEDDLVELVRHEREHAARPEFERMLSNRLDRIRTGR
ncbi:lipid droplet-associated protein [Salinifilum ghardaiensis]